MTAFQVILMLTFGGLLTGTAVAWRKAWASKPVLMAWGGLWLIALAAICWPDATTRVATMLGTRRGADLLLYCTTVALLGGFFMMYVRLRRVRSDLTVLTRQFALMTVHERNGPQPDRNPNKPGRDDECTPNVIGDTETFLKSL